MTNIVTEETLKKYLEGLQVNIRKDTETVIKEQLDILAASISQNTGNIELIKNECSQLKEQVFKQNKTIDNLRRRNNLIVCGIHESNGET